MFALVLAIAATIAAIAIVAVLLTRDNSGKPGSSASAPATPSATNSATPSASASASPSTPAARHPFQLGYQPLYPFASRADALAWQRSSGAGGHQPWRLDAAATAQAFTTGFLGVSEIDQVTSNRTDSSGAHVGVGYRDPNGTSHTAAVLHLVRFGPESEAPWEVVGSDDTTFTVETPAYGARVTSPVTLGGHITGVDENIRVAVRQLSSEGSLGQAGGIPAGGDNQLWSTSVHFVEHLTRT
jgi:hypothetical protein